MAVEAAAVVREDMAGDSSIQKYEITNAGRGANHLAAFLLAWNVATRPLRPHRPAPLLPTSREVLHEQRKISNHLTAACKAPLSNLRQVFLFAGWHPPAVRHATSRRATAQTTPGGKSGGAQADKGRPPELAKDVPGLRNTVARVPSALRMRAQVCYSLD
jgi:hypothetical protein